MADDRDWVFPPELQPRQRDVAFDLEHALNAVVALRSEVPDDAFTAAVLGTERSGNGVVIRDDGLILTIGYLIMEAETLWVGTNDGRVLPAHPLAYDFSTGFGLVHPLGNLDLPSIPRGSAADCVAGDEVFAIGHGGREHALRTRVLARREFAGYWEYLLEDALFVSPPHPQWGGAALLDQEGQLVGIGSLLVEENVDGRDVQGNMFVPADLLEPILEDLLRFGQVDGPARPWLGVYVSEAEGHLVVAGLAPGGPADRAGLRIGDQVLDVADIPIRSLADLFRKVWRLGPAGVRIPLTVGRDGHVIQLALRSADRRDFLRKPRLH